ncbi:MAG: hypothetical protein HZA51_11415 [Planctomycetes bacterium]|nr:hypothetical protein [Planctomycetota bacterium]
MSQRIESITSAANPRIKALASLRRKGSSADDPRILIDGLREITRAAQAGLAIGELYVCRALLAGEEVDAVAGELSSHGTRIIDVPEHVFEKFRYGDRTGGLVAVAERPSKTLADLASHRLETGATRGDRLETGATRGDRLETGATRGDRLETGATRGDRLETGATRDDRLETGATRVDRLETGATRGDRLETGATRGDRLETGATRDDRLETGATRGDRLETGATRGDRLETGATRVDRLETGATAPLIAVVEQVGKPGNLGAILRSADGAGVEAVLAVDSAIDVYGPNVIRASVATVFRIPVVEVSAAEAMAYLKERRFQVVAATPEGGADFTTIDYRGPTAFVFGAEDRGLSRAWTGSDVIAARIPMRGIGDSLNVSITAALFFYEAVRQRAAR